jgi:hypothetical protein
MCFLFTYLPTWNTFEAIGEKPAFLSAEPRRSSLILDLAAPVDRQIYRRKSAISEIPAIVGWGQAECRLGGRPGLRLTRPSTRGEDGSEPLSSLLEISQAAP